MMLTEYERATDKGARRMTYAERVRQLEAEGLCTSDAQAVTDAERLRGRAFAFDPNYPED